MIDPIAKIVWPDFYDSVRYHTKSKRKCMKCGKVFNSNGNKLCVSCNRTNSRKRFVI